MKSRKKRNPFMIMAKAVAWLTMWAAISAILATYVLPALMASEPLRICW